MTRIIALIAAGLALGGGAYWYFEGGSSAESTTENLGITVPEISERAAAGAALFAKNCQACHGKHGSGSDKGPPLIHKIYEPSHHGDASFLMAARNGVRPHHWRFGPMPKIEGVTDSDVSEIVAYVREIQRANGIN